MWHWRAAPPPFHAFALLILGHLLSCHLLHIHQNQLRKQSLAPPRLCSAKTRSSSTAISKQPCWKEGGTNTTVLFSTPFQPEVPGSNEVFLLFAWGLVRKVLVWVLARRQFPRCPVGSLVVTEIPVQQEGQNDYRQHNDDNDHWKTYSVDEWDRWQFHKVIYDQSCEWRGSYRRQLQDLKLLEQLLLLLKEERFFF